MRFFVLCVSDYAGIAPHIIAEVVRDGVADDRRTSLASALAGERALILTRAELLADPVGRTALEAWDDRNDSEYRRESEAILAEDTGQRTRRLRLVEEDDPPRPGRRRVPSDAEHRNVFFRAMALRAVTRELIDRAQEQRATVASRVNGVGTHNGLEVADHE